MKMVKLMVDDPYQTGSKSHKERSETKVWMIVEAK
jgi:hypothetical protein